MWPELNHGFSVSRQHNGFAQFDLCDQFLKLNLCIFNGDLYHHVHSSRRYEITDK